MYKQCRIYGPYRRKDNRQHVVVIFPDGSRKTVSYPRYLTECRIGRILEEDETVDHIDGDFNNNEPSNIRIVDRSTHAGDDAKRYKEQSFICPECQAVFKLIGKKLHDAVVNRQRGKAGPFCGRSCAGRYSKRVQMGAKPLKPVEIDVTYTTRKTELSLQGETLGVDAAKTGKP